MSQTHNGTPIPVPHLAESLVAATVGKWLKQPGDRVEQYEVICELSTEKVNVDMPAPVAGVLTEIAVGENKTASVGDTLCYILEPNEAGSAAPSIAQPAAETGPAALAAAGGLAAPGSAAAQAGASGSAPHGGTAAQAGLAGLAADRAAADARLASLAPGAEGAADGGMRSRFSPAVLKLAAENGVSLSDVDGTGLGGRITRKDVLDHVAAGRPRRASQAPAASEAPALQAPAVPVRSTGLHLSQQPPTPLLEVERQTDAGRGEYMIDVTPIRNTIATRMRQSVSEIPHAWTMIEVDVTNLVVLRNKLKDEFIRQEGINLTYLAFLLKAVVNAIKDYPIMNSVWAVDKIIVKKDINLSLAVGTEDSVITPVIKKADQKNIAGLAREIDELTKKARAGKLALSDLQGGTFTVNNTGSFGSILSYPIINYPQAAILTFESIVKKPVVINDMIAVRSMVNLCLSLDHRILDGVICGRFLQRVKENLESYNADTKLY